MEKKDYLALCEQINQHNKLYYIDNNPIISDTEYDRMLRELQSIESAHPEWIIANSPAWQVGGNKYGSITGLISLDKAYDYNDLHNWYSRIRPNSNDICLLAEPKYDGCAVCIDYDNGKLVRMSLRDGGNADHDVTDKADAIRNIPTTICYKSHIQIRGEVYVSMHNFLRYNIVQNLSTPRSAVNGAMLARGGKLCRERYVEFVAWGFDGIPCFKFYSEAMDIISSWGFSVPPRTTLDTIQKCEDVVSHITKTFSNIPMDGVVFKVEDMRLWSSIGTTAHHPKYMIAYKLQSDAVWTILRNVRTQISSNGKATPVAEFDTVVIENTNVSNACLDNPTKMKSSFGNLRIGDEVLVKKAGGTRPTIIDVNHIGTGRYVVIETCPFCGSTLVHHRNMDGSMTQDVFCDNPKCECRTIERTKAGKVKKRASAPTLNTVTIAAASLNKKALDGLSVVISGTFDGNYSRTYLEFLISECGGKHTKKVSGKTAFVIAGKDMGSSKLKEAKDLGVPLITDNEFIRKIMR